MDLQKELDELVERMEIYINCNCPSWLTPNSTFMGIEPGHNLDVLKIAFDFRINRSEFLRREVPQVLKDPSLADLTLVRGDNEA